MKKQIKLGYCTVDEVKKVDAIVKKVEEQTGSCNSIKDAFLRLGHKALTDKVEW